MHTNPSFSLEMRVNYVNAYSFIHAHTHAHHDEVSARNLALPCAQQVPNYVLARKMLVCAWYVVLLWEHLSVMYLKSMGVVFIGT